MRIIQTFAKEFNINVEDIRNFKLPNYPVPAMKKSLSDVVDEGLKKIHDKWLKSQLQTDILMHNNASDVNIYPRTTLISHR